MRIGQSVEVGNHTITVPVLYEEFRTVPGDPPRALSIGTVTEMGSAVVIAYPVGEEDSLPFGDEGEIVRGLRSSMGVRQGIVEVNEGNTPGGGLPFSWFIVKSKGDAPGNLQYILALDARFGEGDIIHVQGYFDEGPITGVRASMMFDAMLRAGEVRIGKDDGAISGWMADPYDPSVTEGFLMNRGEAREFDRRFPWHPLTLARGLADTIVGSL